MDFTIYVLSPLIRVRKSFRKKIFNKEKMEETPGRATEVICLSQEGHTINRCCTSWPFTTQNIQIVKTRFLIVTHYLKIGERLNFLYMLTEWNQCVNFEAILYNHTFSLRADSPAFSLSAIMLFSVDRVKPLLVMWDTWQLLCVQLSSDHLHSEPAC